MYLYMSNRFVVYRTEAVVAFLMALALRPTVKLASRARSATFGWAAGHLTLCCMSSFSSVLETLPKIASYRLPTHRRGAHRNFFHGSFLNRIFGYTYIIVTAMQQRVSMAIHDRREILWATCIPSSGLVILCSLPSSI